MEPVVHILLIVAAVAHGAAVLARAEARRLREAARPKPWRIALATSPHVTVNITADASAFEDAIGRLTRHLQTLGGAA